MGGFLGRWIVAFFAVIAALWLLQGGGWVSYSGDLVQLAVFALVLALLNAFVRPILLILTLPLNILTLGLFILVVNAIIFWLATVVSPAVKVNGFGGAFLAALVVSVASFIANRFVQ
jgi:putative membrane protein